MWSNEQIVSTKQVVECHDKDARLFKRQSNITLILDYVHLSNIIISFLNILNLIVNVRLPQCAGERRCLDYNPAVF